MAKALIGHLALDRRDPRDRDENARLRRRIAELEALVERLAIENDELSGRLEGRIDEHLLADDARRMQPA